MADDLTVSGSGSSVVTEELYAAAAQLHALAAEARSLRDHLGAIDKVVSFGWGQHLALPSSAGRAELDLDQAVIVMMQIEAIAGALEWALATVADGYGFVEQFIQGLLGQLAGDVGAALPGLVISTLGGVAALGSAGGAIAGINLAGGVHRGASSAAGIPKGPEWARRNNEIITNPLTVSGLRVLTDAVGEAALGATRTGPLESAGLVTGVGVAAGLGMRAGSTVGALTETPVRLVGAQSQPVDGHPPASFTERLSRVPDPEANGGAQVLIEKYSTADGAERYEVYVAGTVTFSPIADREPWDMTSNLGNAAARGSGSYDSVVAAMRDAGIGPDDPVQLTGYSQGGGTVARIAESGEFAVAGVASFGGPTGQVRLPTDVPALIVEHTDDPVPALGGRQDNDAAVIVQRRVFDGPDIPEDYAVPAHHREYYERTAQLMDAHAEGDLTSTAARLAAFTGGAALVSSTAYRFERVSETSAGR